MSVAHEEPSRPSAMAEGSDPLPPTLIPASREVNTPQSTNSLRSKAGPVFPSSGIAFEEETRRLLHYRLWVVHAAGSMVMAGLTLMTLVGHPVLTADSGMSRKTAWFPAIVLVECLIVTTLLWRRRSTSLETLRVLELAIFFLLALIGSVIKLTVLAFPHQHSQDDPRYTDLLLRYGGSITNLPFLFAILIYGVLIPNSRRRSLTVVAALCFIPVAVTLLAAAINPTLRTSLDVILPITAMNVFMAGVIAVVSAARTQTLRQEVYDARREARQVGHYTLKRKLGEGGMGEVFLAEHKLLKRPCAVKLIRADLAANQANALRFEREVRAMTALTHFNTVRIYDYGRATDGSFYYVMEYLEGLTLDSLVRTYGPLSPARSIDLLRQVCGALTEAHAAGLVHRDLKPGNILVATLGGQHDVAKLLDFGLVQDLSAIETDPRLTQTGTVLGTPAYMCPEQAGGDAAIDARGDIYSLGAVAFFVLSGRPPFDAQSVGKLLAAHLTQSPPSLVELNKEIPNDLAFVVERCLAKAPSERFQTAAELEVALGGCGCARDWSPTHAANWWAQHPKAKPTDAVNNEFPGPRNKL